MSELGVLRKRANSPKSVQLARHTEASDVSKRSLVATSTEWNARNGNAIFSGVSDQPNGGLSNVGEKETEEDDNLLTGGNSSRVKGPWTAEEDVLLSKLVAEYGPKKWSVIASHVPGRVGKQCRERWLNHLDSSVKKDPWSEEEDITLIRAQEKIGNRWCEISKMLPGRPENAVKNRWNSLMNKRLTGKSAIAASVATSSATGNATHRAKSTQQSYGGNVFVPANSIHAKSPPPSSKKKVNSTMKKPIVPPTVTTKLRNEDRPSSSSSNRDSEFEWPSGFTPVNSQRPKTRSPSTKIKSKFQPPPVQTNPPAHQAFGDFELSSMHGTPMGVSSLFGGMYTPLNGGDLFGEMDLLPKTPNFMTSGTRTPLTTGIVGLSLDDGIEDLLQYPLQVTPTNMGQYKRSPTRVGTIANRDSSNLDAPFGNDFDFDFDNAPSLQKSQSPVARNILHLNSLHREGKISDSEKARMKNEILKEKR